MVLPVTYSAREVAESLGIGYRSLTSLARTHPDNYPSLKVGNRVRFTEEQVATIVQSLTRRSNPSLADAWGRPALAVTREANRRRDAATAGRYGGLYGPSLKRTR